MPTNDQQDQTHTDHSLQDGYLQIIQSGKTEKVLYVAANRSERWSDPEEKVRAEFYAELIYRYGYSPDRIGVEITVPDRSPNDYADLVVFHDDERKRPFAVIECKREAISDAEFNQAVEQAWGNGNAHKFRAAYVGVVAGATRRFLDCNDKKFGALERDKNVVADLPQNYGKPPEYKYRKGVSREWQDIKPVSKGELIAAIKKCHQTLWGGGRLSPPAAFGEFCKIIFVKVRDEKATRKKGEPYEFQIKTDESAQALASRIKAMYAVEMKREPDVFKDPIKVDDGTLKMCVSHLESINFNKTDLDTKGVAFEQFLDGFFKGDFGQYFTPREIIQFAVEVLKPSADDYVLDPACGSGGFLLYAMDYVRHAADRIYDADEVQDRFRHWHDFAKDRLFGLEINDEISRVAKMNMILHDDGHTNIAGFDALEKFDKLKDQNRKLSPDTFDLVLTNPPFGAMVKQSEKGKAYMEGWELLRYVGKGEQGDGGAGEMQSDYKAGKKSLKARTSIKTEILFCERVWQFLKPGGRAAIVLPDGILTNSSLQGVRDWLLDRFQVLAVISLPQEAFQHSGAGVKASIVFLRKRPLDEKPDDNEAIFMAQPANIGYDATGRKTYRVEIKSENGRRKVERHITDLFEMEVTFEKLAAAGKGEEEWQEKSRQVLPYTGVLGEYRAFEKEPAPFFA